MWKIHGKLYNLTDFLDKHPGGRRILETCRGNNDLTPAFESCHAMSDMTKIKKMMTKYELFEIEQSNYTFNEKEFYKTIQQRVKKIFVVEGYHHKANNSWLIKSSIQLIIFTSLFIQSFYNHNLSLLIRMILGFLSGHFLVQVGFNVMHDASHFAISKNNKINTFLSDLINCLLIWDSHLWEKHHVFRHHSFTGNTSLDPDTINLRPFIRKIEEDDKNKYLKIDNIHPILFTILITLLIPGMFTGQMVAYLLWYFRGYI